MDRNDLISRSELKKAFNKWWGCEDIPATVVEDLIDNAPTVHHSNCANCEDKALSYSMGFQDGYMTGKARPQGEWIIQPHSMIMKCSLCGHEENAKDVGTINPDKHFCSNCGADLGGKEE